MRDRYQPGYILVLPSGRRVVIQHVRPQQLVCKYETPRHGDRRHGVLASDADLLLARLFCDRHMHLVPVLQPELETMP
jgi:hypothetical protein